jgi:hypothetical protein
MEIYISGIMASKMIPSNLLFPFLKYLFGNESKALLRSLAPR